MLLAVGAAVVTAAATRDDAWTSATGGGADCAAPGGVRSVSMVA
jgi:hypothetical protein